MNNILNTINPRLPSAPYPEHTSEPRVWILPRELPPGTPAIAGLNSSSFSYETEPK